MKHFSNRKKNNKEKTESKIFLSVLIFLCLSIAGLLLYSNYNVSKKRQQLLIRINALKQEIGVLEERNADLKQGMADIKDDAYWERRMRDLGYKKPGETMVVVNREGINVNNSGDKEVINNASVWQKFLGGMKNILE